MGITFTIFKRLGNLPLEKDLLINPHKGFIIKSGIILRSFIGMLLGPVDLLSRVFMISRTSSSDTSEITKSN